MNYSIKAEIAGKKVSFDVEAEDIIQAVRIVESPKIIAVNPAGNAESEKLSHSENRHSIMLKLAEILEKKTRLKVEIQSVRLADFLGANIQPGVKVESQHPVRTSIKSVEEIAEAFKTIYGAQPTQVKGFLQILEAFDICINSLKAIEKQVLPSTTV